MKPGGPGAGLLVAAALAWSSLGCARVLHNFGTVEPERVYRSAQPSPLLLRWVAWRHGIRSIVSLRGRTPGYESAFAARHSIRIHSFDLSARRPPSEQDVSRFLAILADASNHPVLVHCLNGVDRTGTMLGIYRVTRGGWTAEQATREMNRYFQFAWRNPVPQSTVRSWD